ncbi:MAG TPA: Hpt domain-containing protein [Candidatus Omnitrophota bacterium]|nr:Hpt domain-containing protein [Candidatus Omnitrophota bacterium]
MNEDLFDVKEFLERVQDDKELLVELIGIYLEDYEGKRKILGEAIVNNDYEAVRSVAHSLKGSSGNISAKSLRELFWKLEDMGKANNLNGASDLLQKVDGIFEQFVKRVSNLKEEMGV